MRPYEQLNSSDSPSIKKGRFEYMIPPLCEGLVF